MPTSLTRFLPSTRGYSPWRPVADICTASCEHKDHSLGFQGPTATDRIAQRKHYSSSAESISRAKLIPCSAELLARKDNSSRCNRKFLRVLLRYRFVNRNRLATSTRENINSLPFRPREQYRGITPLSLRHSAVALGPTHPCSIAVYRNHSPLRPSRISLDYSLLLPRSALAAASVWLTPAPSTPPPRLPTH